MSWSWSSPFQVVNQGVFTILSQSQDDSLAEACSAQRHKQPDCLPGHTSTTNSSMTCAALIGPDAYTVMVVTSVWIASGVIDACVSLARRSQAAE